MKKDLGLSNSFLGTDHPEMLTGYNLKNRDVESWELSSEDYFCLPVGGISSNASDLLDFATLHMNRTLEYLELTHHLSTTNAPEGAINTLEMGLGWWHDIKYPNTLVHMGNTHGHASILILDKEKKTAVVILVNVIEYEERDELALDILENL